MRALITFTFLLLSSIAFSKPSVDKIDYTTPENYLEIVESLGDLTDIRALVTTLKGDSDIKTIENIIKWMRSSLKVDRDTAYHWRNFDDVYSQKSYLCCADYGITCGVLLKAAGIPTVWVKTMDVTWIWDFKKKRPFQTYSGHVFLEVYAEHQWMLLDPGAQKLYRNYSPKSRILPGNRFAYHKGNDPKSMIMSLQWEKWKKQTKAYFTALDESLLPVDKEAKLLAQAYIIGNNLNYKKLIHLAEEKGYRILQSFNADYDNLLPKAQGHTLIIETHGKQPIVSKEVLEKHFPKAFDGLENNDGIIVSENTTIIFYDFSAPKPNQLSIRAEE